MVARISAFVIWALVAATAVFWGLRLLVRAPAAPSYAVAVGDASAVRADLSRVLGSAPVTAAAAVAAPEASSRFKLIGIMAPKGAQAAVAPASTGVALIAVDGKPPKAFVVGSQLDGDLVLQSVSLRTASIGPAQGAASVKLELPALPAAATGTLAPSSSGSSTGMPAPAPAPVALPQPVSPRPGLVPAPAPMPPPQAVPPATQQQQPVEGQQNLPSVAPPPLREPNLPTK
jgi:general secretion pathway protein C